MGRLGIKSVTFLSQPSIKFEFLYFAPYPPSPSLNDKATDRPALYEAEGVAISLVMHLISCQQLGTCQLNVITLYLQHLNFSSSKHAHRCISSHLCKILRRCQRCGCSSHRRKSQPGGRGERELAISHSPNPTLGEIITSVERFIQPEKSHFTWEQL